MNQPKYTIFCQTLIPQEASVGLGRSTFKTTKYITCNFSNLRKPSGNEVSQTKKLPFYPLAFKKPKSVIFTHCIQILQAP